MAWKIESLVHTDTNNHFKFVWLCFTSKPILIGYVANNSLVNRSAGLAVNSNLELSSDLEDELV